jgi:protein ImuA
VRNDVPGGDSGVLVPLAGVAKAGGARARVLIEQLRAEIRALEQVPVSLAIPPAPDAAPPHRPACSLASNPLQSPPPSRKREESFGKLKGGGLHEIRPQAYRDRPAALGFALALIAERTAEHASSDLVLWCFTKEVAREWGRPYGPGLIACGLDPALFLLVEARNESDAAWALEEGLKSRALVAALAGIEIKTELTARRLSLAAQASRTPCLLLSDHRHAGLPGTFTSWRIAAENSGPALFDASAPGAPSWHLTLTRCRGEAPGRNFVVEFNHESFRIHLSAASSARAADAGESSIRRRAARR